MGPTRVSRFLETALSIAKPDWTIGQTKDIADMFRRFYNIGVDEAAQVADGWSREAAGGAPPEKGSSGEGYANLGESIRRLTAP